MARWQPGEVSVQARSIVSRVLLAAALISVLGGCGSAESRKERYYARGESFLNEGNFSKASLELRNALQIDPHYLPAHLALGQTDEKLGNPRGALGEYLAVIDADPQGIEARALAGRLYIVAGLSAEALKVIGPGLEKHPTDPQLLTVRGAAHAQQGDVQGALADATQAYRSDSGNMYAIALLASIYPRVGRGDEGLALVRRSVAAHGDSIELHTLLADLLLTRQDSDGAIHELQRVIQLEPLALGPRFQLARLYAGRNDLDGAEKTLRAAINVVPDDLTAKLTLIDFLRKRRNEAAVQATLKEYIHKRPSDNQLQLQLAMSYQRAGDTQQTEAICQDIIQRAGSQTPDAIVAREMLASLRLAAGNNGEALKLINELLADNPRDNQAFLLRADIKIAAHDTDGAIADLRAILHDDPNSVVALSALAKAYSAKGEPSLAQESLRTALAANPRESHLRLELAQLLGDTDEGESVLSGTPKDTPADAVVLEALFRLQSRRKEYDRARSTAAAVSHAMPTQGMGDYLQGTVDEADGKTDAAVQDYVRALEVQPDAVEPLNALVQLYVGHGQTDRALQQLDWVLAKASHNQVAFNLQGQLLAAQKRFAEATQAFQSAVAAAPQWWVPYQNLSRVQTQMGATPAAIDTLNRGLMQTHYNLTLAAELAGIEELSGNPERAIDVYEHVLTEDPHSLPASNSLAMLLVSLRTDAVSLGRAQRLAAPFESSTDPRYQDTLGWVRFKSGQYAQALTLLRTAAQAAPESALVRFHLGMAQLRTGDSAQGRRNLQEAIDSGRPFLGMNEARSTLAELKKVG
jgi:tetratricopeptide (TPR) repeat protein